MTRPATSSRTARTLTSIGVFGAAVLLSSCQSLSPQTTELQYDAADGTSTTIGSLKFTDLAIISSAAGQPGKVQGMVTNSSNGPVTVKITGGSGTARDVTVPGLTALRLDGQGSGDATSKIEPVTLNALKDGPGKTSTVSFATGAGTVPVEVPVLLDQYPYGDATVTHPPASPTKKAGEGEDGHGAEEAPAEGAH